VIEGVVKENIPDDRSRKCYNITAEAIF